MKKVYLIRHALPDFPAWKKMCIGTTDIPLGGEGFAQAARMAEKLPVVTAVFSSPLTRAVQTAQTIGVSVTVVDDLRELHMGAWDGLTFDEIRQQYPELYAARGNDLTIPMPGAEDAEAGLARFADAMRCCAMEAPGDLVVVTHGGIIARFLQEISGTWYKPGYAEIISLVWDGVNFELQETVSNN